MAFRILVVEDDADNLEMMQVVLAADGHQAEPCSTASQALRLCHEGGREFDLVLLDVQLPDMSGLEFLRLLRADDRTREWPVLCVSASVRRTDEQSAREAGADHYLAKPFRRKDLLAAIDVTMGKRPPNRPRPGG